MARIRVIFLILIFSLGVSEFAYSQKDGKGPPEPNKQQGGRRGPPCDPGNGNGNGGGNGGGNGNGQGVPPPVGLCLPIDDYVYILMAVGAMYGCYKLRDFENTKTVQ
ncbi:hypothetical protein ML462_04425 [Gramella lutea]|uniref:Uncharacterized protein n=1 Tax=Christiangramia lutea TaxID=1607951 RepID=A0A9X1V218_9FLAO|nr:hypothetical protein [Christiangramia lutea]MCH4822410.1 hypothetical protein [Christiangramia lutea]